MKAYVLVGVSSRLPGKHIIEVIPGKRLIDIVVENLQHMGLDVVIYSRIPLKVDVPVIEDKTSWILEAVCSLLRQNNHFLLFGGDMPLIAGEAVETLIMHWDGRNGVVPRWDSTGYLEPLHAIYTRQMLPCLCNAESLTKGIQSCPYVRFISAEEMPEETFFNVNTQDDMRRLRGMLSSQKTIFQD